MSGTDLDRGARAAAELTEEIERTRAALGETIAQLAERVDVKARVRAARARTTARARGVARTPVTWLVLAAGGMAVLAVAAVAIQRRRR